MVDMSILQCIFYIYIYTHIYIYYTYSVFNGGYVDQLITGQHMVPLWFPVTTPVSSSASSKAIHTVTELFSRGRKFSEIYLEWATKSLAKYGKSCLDVARINKVTKWLSGFSGVYPKKQKKHPICKLQGVATQALTFWQHRSCGAMKKRLAYRRPFWWTLSTVDTHIGDGHPIETHIYLGTP